MTRRHFEDPNYDTIYEKKMDLEDPNLHGAKGSNNSPLPPLKRPLGQGNMFLTRAGQAQKGKEKEMTPEQMAEAKSKAEAAAKQKAEEKAKKTAEKTAKKEARAQAQADKQQNNGVTRPKSGTKTGQVWDIADAISSETNKPAPRKDVIARGEAAGLNAATIATQYGRWRKYHGLTGPLENPAPPAPPAPAAAPATA